MATIISSVVGFIVLGMSFGFWGAFVILWSIVVVALFWGASGRIAPSALVLSTPFWWRNIGTAILSISWALLRSCLFVSTRGFCVVFAHFVSLHDRCDRSNFFLLRNISEVQSILDGRVVKRSSYIEGQSAVHWCDTFEKIVCNIWRDESTVWYHTYIHEDTRCIFLDLWLMYGFLRKTDPRDWERSTTKDRRPSD